MKPRLAEGDMVNTFLDSAIKVRPVGCRQQPARHPLFSVGYRKTKWGVSPLTRSEGLSAPALIFGRKESVVVVAAIMVIVVVVVTAAVVVVVVVSAVVVMIDAVVVVVVRAAVVIVRLDL